MSLDTDIAALQADVAQLKAQQTLPAQLLDGVSALLGRRDLTQVEFANWAGGSATGGPAGDGLYPLTDAAGFTRNVPSPARTHEVSVLAVGSGARSRGALVAGQTTLALPEAVPVGKSWWVRLWIRGIEQEPEVDYTAAGTTLTLSPGLAATIETGDAYRFLVTAGLSGGTSQPAIPTYWPRPTIAFVTTGPVAAGWASDPFLVQAEIVLSGECVSAIQAPAAAACIFTLMCDDDPMGTIEWPPGMFVPILTIEPSRKLVPARSSLWLAGPLVEDASLLGPSIELVTL